LFELTTNVTINWLLLQSGFFFKAFGIFFGAFGFFTFSSGNPAAVGLA